MTKKTLYTLVAALAITIGYDSYSRMPYATERSEGNGAYDGFAKCVTEKGARLYGTKWCPPCKDQKAEFGSSFQYINYTDCDEKPEECSKAHIHGYPTWTFADSTRYLGKISLEDLAKKTGCELKKD